MSVSDSKMENYFLRKQYKNWERRIKAIQRNGLFLNLAHTHPFYLVLGAALSIRPYVLLYTSSNYIFHPVIDARLRRASSTAYRRLSSFASASTTSVGW